MALSEWEAIRNYILLPKFKELCSNIAKRSGLNNDLYQELMLCLLEKIEHRKESFAAAWEGRYIDYYIVSTANTMFHGKHTVIERMRFTSNTTGTPEFCEYCHEVEESEVLNENYFKACEEALKDEYWYNQELFKQYVHGGDSIRTIEKKTGIPRNSIHRVLSDTRSRIRKKVEAKLKEV